MLTKIKNSLSVTKTDDGASAVEYGLLVAAIAALIVVIVFLLGHVVSDVFQKTCDNVSSGTTNGASATC